LPLARSSANLASSPLQAATLRGLGHSDGLMNAQVDDWDWYGRDPRLRTGGLVCDDARKWARNSVLPGRVNEMGNVHQLQAAIDVAASGELIVVKFQRDSCPACVATHSQFVRTAKQWQRSSFFVVDAKAHKQFCKEEVGLKALPSVHVYRDGELRAALPLNKQEWPTFARVLKQSRRAGAGALSPRRTFCCILAEVNWQLRSVASSALLRVLA